VSDPRTHYCPRPAGCGGAEVEIIHPPTSRCKPHDSACSARDTREVPSPRVVVPAEYAHRMDSPATPLVSARARARGETPHPDVITRAMAAVRGPYIALALYGSQARGTQRVDSDIDVLHVVSTAPGKYSDGDVNVTAYNIDTLRSMSVNGSLFMLHLRTDGHIISDPTGVLKRIFDDYRQPPNFAKAIAELAAAARALTVDDSAAYEDGLRKLGIYVARTACYAVLADRGEPEFDPEVVSRKLGIPSMARALRMRLDPPQSDDLEVLYLALLDLLGDIPPAETTLDSLAVQLLHESPYAATLMAQVLAGPTEGFEYTALAAPPI